MKKEATNSYNLSKKVKARVKDNYSGSDLYVFRYEYKNDGTWCLRKSKPCAHCTQLIKIAGIRHVYYSDCEEGESPKIVKTLAKDLFTTHLTYGRRRIKK